MGPLRDTSPRSERERGDRIPLSDEHCPETPKAGMGRFSFPALSFHTTGPVLVVMTVVVDALAPLLQERASKVAGFEGSLMVVAETMSYYLGGLLVALLTFGPAGLRRCVQPARYVAFLPASFAFSASNFLTYIAVRGLGASQFYLLAQLRIAILAIVHRYRSGVVQPIAAWVALLQLATGMVVLVWYKSSMAQVEAVLDSVVHCGLPGVPSATPVKSAVPHATDHDDFLPGFLALVGVVLTSAFGFLYLEWQLKLHAQDPIFVQLHQMNSFGAAASLLLHLLRREEETAAHLVASQLAVGNATGAADPSQVVAVEAVAAMAADAAQEGPGFAQVATLLMCIIARGVLSGSVLKHLDSIAKGLIDVTAIVLCTCLQIFDNPESANGTVLGIQMLMLLSIVTYQQVRAQGPRSAAAGEPSSSPILPALGGRRVLPKSV